MGGIVSKPSPPPPPPPPPPAPVEVQPEVDPTERRRRSAVRSRQAARPLLSGIDDQQATGGPQPGTQNTLGV